MPADTRHGGLSVQLRDTLESTIEVDVISANELNEQQLAKISAAMEKRLSRKVKLNCKIDKSVIAGVITKIRQEALLHSLKKDRS